MKVTVVFFGDFVRFKPAGWPGKRGSVDVPEGATIDTLADQMGIGEEPCVVMLNEEAHHRGAELHEGDTVTFLPPLAGGRGRASHRRITPPQEPRFVAYLAASGAQLRGRESVRSSTGTPPMDEVARCQEKAAELVLGDEAWRGALPDEVATPLLDWALRCTDAALQARASGGPEAAESLADAAYAAADQARTVLGTLALLGAGGSEEQMWQGLQAHLGPPLFDSPEQGEAAVHDVLVSAGLTPAEAASDTLPEEPEGQDHHGGFRWE